MAKSRKSGHGCNFSQEEQKKKKTVKKGQNKWKIWAKIGKNRQIVKSFLGQTVTIDLKDTQLVDSFY